MVKIDHGFSFAHSYPQEGGVFRSEILHSSGDLLAGGDFTVVPVPVKKFKLITSQYCSLNQL